MKKFLSIVLIVIILSLLSAGIYLTAVRFGFMSVEAGFSGNGTPVSFDTGSEEGGNLISLYRSEYRNGGKTDRLPGPDHIRLNLFIKYFPDMTVAYPVFIDPYEKEGLIDMGLFKTDYREITEPFLNLLLSSKKAEVVSKNGEAFNLTNGEFDLLLNSMQTGTVLGETSVPGAAYTVTATLYSGAVINMDLGMAPSDGRVYILCPDGICETDSGFADVFLSKDQVFEEHVKPLKTLPGIDLVSSYPFEAFEVAGTWKHVKPDGETHEEDLTEERDASSQTIHPEVSVSYRTGGSRKPDSLILREFVDGVETSSTDLLSGIHKAPDSETDVEYVLEAVYNPSGEHPDYGTIVKKYSLRTDAPAQSRVRYGEVRPGEVLAFVVDYADDDESFGIETDLNGFSAAFAPYGNKFIAYVPVNWWTRPGEYTAKIYNTSGGVRTLMSEYPVTVLPDNFETTNQQLVVSEELAQKAGAEASAYDGPRVAAAKSSTNPTSYLEGPFIMPLEGALGTSFGRTRYINWKNPYRHSGLDIDGETGDPIIAANRGVVVMAEELIRCGNTVIIDHGMGLFTSYLHMSGIDVSVGDFVEKGDLLGKVGSTGFSTGSHLHWAATLNGNYISPLWLVGNPLVPD